jgi:putative two-component system response regulator
LCQLSRVAVDYRVTLAVIVADLILPVAVSACVAMLAAGAGLATAVRSRTKRLASERLLTRHQEMSLDLICTASFDGFFIQLSPSWTKVLGFELEELQDRPFIDFIHPDDLAATLAEVDKQTKLGQQVLNFQNRYRCADGSYRWLEWTSQPDYASNLLFAVARDVTERREAEDVLARYHELLEDTVAARTAELEGARLETLRCLALAAEYRDDQTYEHTQRVGRTSALLGERLGLTDKLTVLLRHAAPLHDVGKVGVPDSILLKPAELTPEEFELVREHTTAGARILGASNSDLLLLAQEIALTHHEWWNGNGYPNGLSGEEIPLSGRIVAVADVFDALTHERPYKRAWTVSHSVREMHRLSGLQFDPTVLDAFAQLDPYQLAESAMPSTAAPLRAVG